jgi:hypothetical protein
LTNSHANALESWTTESSKFQVVMDMNFVIVTLIKKKKRKNEIEAFFFLIMPKAAFLFCFIDYIIIKDGNR